MVLRETTFDALAARVVGTDELDRFVNQHAGFVAQLGVLEPAELHNVVIHQREITAIAVTVDECHFVGHGIEDEGEEVLTGSSMRSRVSIAPASHLIGLISEPLLRKHDPPCMLHMQAVGVDWVGKKWACVVFDGSSAQVIGHRTSGEVVEALAGTTDCVGGDCRK